MDAVFRTDNIYGRVNAGWNYTEKHCGRKEKEISEEESGRERMWLKERHCAGRVMSSRGSPDDSSASRSAFFFEGQAAFVSSKQVRPTFGPKRG
jgi:hypothetical protein